MPKSCGWCVNSEDHTIWVTFYKLGIRVQNCWAIIWGEGRRKIFYVSEWWFGFPPPSHNFTKQWQEGFANLSPNVTWPFWVAIWLWHPWVLSENVKKIKKSRVQKICLKAQILCVCVRVGGFESGCHFAVGLFLFLFLFLISKLHKAGALPRRIWCRKAQATLKIQASKENRKNKSKNGYSYHLRLSG